MFRGAVFNTSRHIIITILTLTSPPRGEEAVFAVVDDRRSAPELRFRHFCRRSTARPRRFIVRLPSRTLYSFFFFKQFRLSQMKVVVVVVLLSRLFTCRFLWTQKL